MGREKTGKRYRSFEDLERRWPRIPPGMLQAILFETRLPIGIYGTGLYGQCIYGITYGYYGISSYDDCHYLPPGYGFYGTSTYDDSIYH